MNWQELTSDEFPQAVQQAQEVCLAPLSVIERHGHHLPTGTDMFIGRELCQHAAALEPVMVFPDVIFTQILEARHVPGTIALDAELIMRYNDIVRAPIVAYGLDGPIDEIRPELKPDFRQVDPNRLPVKIEALDEYMEALWYLSEENDLSLERLRNLVDVTFNDEIIGYLTSEQLIQVTGKKLELTPNGYKQAKQIIRCHRLAERLLADVLGMPLKEMEQGACEFEHILAPEIVDSICTLLGHPSECPHGLKIPEGKCCSQARETFTSAIVPLSRVQVGDQVKVCYINTKSDSRIHKLCHFGRLSPAPISRFTRNHHHLLSSMKIPGSESGRRW